MVLSGTMYTVPNTHSHTHRMALSDKDKQIAYAIVAHLQSQMDSKRLSEEQSEGVSVAIQCLSEAYGVEPGDQSHRAQYGTGKTLEVLFTLCILHTWYTLHSL